MSARITRPLAGLAIVAAAVATSGCIMAPPTQAPAPPATSAATEPSSPASQEPSASASTEPMYDIVADGHDGSRWSFQVGSIEVVETDSLGDPAQPGHKLVVVEVDGQLLDGEPDFYYAFHMYIVDDRNGDEWGLSSGTNWYAEGDLFSAGQEPEFTGYGIYHLPEDVPIDHIRFATSDGWTHDVEP